MLKAVKTYPKMTEDAAIAMGLERPDLSLASKALERLPAKVGRALIDSSLLPLVQLPLAAGAKLVPLSRVKAAITKSQSLVVVCKSCGQCHAITFPLKLRTCKSCGITEWEVRPSVLAAVDLASMPVRVCTQTYKQ